MADLFKQELDNGYVLVIKDTPNGALAVQLQNSMGNFVGQTFASRDTLNKAIANLTNGELTEDDIDLDAIFGDEEENESYEDANESVFYALYESNCGEDDENLDEDGEEIDFFNADDEDEDEELEEMYEDCVDAFEGMFNPFEYDRAYAHNFTESIYDFFAIGMNLNNLSEFTNYYQDSEDIESLSNIADIMDKIGFGPGNGSIITDAARRGAVDTDRIFDHDLWELLCDLGEDFIQLYDTDIDDIPAIQTCFARMANTLKQALSDNQFSTSREARDFFNEVNSWLLVQANDSYNASPSSRVLY